jgi:hypothetical protein
LEYQHSNTGGNTNIETLGEKQTFRHLEIPTFKHWGRYKHSDTGEIQTFRHLEIPTFKHWGEYKYPDNGVIQKSRS